MVLAYRLLQVNWNPDNLGGNNLWYQHLILNWYSPFKMSSITVFFPVSVQQKAVKIIYVTYKKYMLQMLFVFTGWFIMRKYLLKYTFMFHGYWHTIYYNWNELSPLNKNFQILFLLFIRIKIKRVKAQMQPIGKC